MAIVEAKADSLMCAYNSVDGVPACANEDLLVKRLRGEWGFSGFVVSDCGAITDIFRGHQYKKTAAEASAVAVKAGTDLTCGNEYRSLVDAVKGGLITEAEVNQSLERLFVGRFKLGMFDPPERVPYSKIPYSENDSEGHRKLALEAARKSIVLLKNENQVLPLKAAVKKIAVIGPSADDPIALLGNYNGFSQKHVTPLEGIERQFAGKAEVRYALGSTYTSQTAVPMGGEALVPPSGAGHGLLAEFFDNPDVQGQAKAQRVEPRLFLHGGNFDPVRLGLPARGFSVRWTGTLRPPVTGEYTIEPAGAVRLFVDDQELVSEAPQGAAPGRGPRPPLHVQLEAGHPYRFRAEYRAQQFGAQSVQVLWLPPAQPLLAQAVEAVRNADVAVAFVGLNPNLEGEEMRVNVPGFQGGDRTNLEIPETQAKLIEAAVGAGKPVVVVLTSGSALAANYAAEHAAAVLQLWYGGEEAGTAIGETLAGTNNPAGRLPVTFYKSADQLPAFDDYSMKGRTYRYFTGEPLYGFGYGLSYSSFQYSGARGTRTGSGARVSVRVKNGSSREGDEVVQLYVKGGGGAEDAARTLKGFQRVHLKAGESREVVFTLGTDDLPKGKAQVSVGGGQPVGKVAHVEVTL